MLDFTPVTSEHHHFLLLHQTTAPRLSCHCPYPTGRPNQLDRNLLTTNELMCELNSLKTVLTSKVP